VYVLTNAHVVDSADEITVTLWDNREFDGSIVGSDTARDLALVVFETDEDVPIAQLGDSDSVQVGDWAFAVGNPLGFESTVTAGIISGVGRPASSGVGGQLTDYLQTDAAINQGNSGGALVNLAGEVIGINSWIASQNGGNVGLGFAIPINNAKRAIDQFISYGQVEYGYLGVFFGGAITDDVAVSMGTRHTTGAFVGSVLEDSPADRAGIQPGDIITEIDGQPIDDWTDLTNAVADLAPGTRTVFTVRRNGDEITVRPRLARREAETSAAQAWPGITVLPLTDDLRTQLNLRNERGSIVIADVYANSPASEAGLSRGDIIRQVNGEDVGSLAEFYNAVNGRSGDDLVFRLVRQGREYVIGLVR
jgi:serine protease Do